ncbi:MULTISPECIES: 2'-deoxycytidine 5'-triphosphate deaminase [Rhizobium/Agrobacterium group]|uniref:2'-deoxycytidine 5'-triphosphate deaminase n=1 Tax=Rhizobium/Agrobacterium group TaxID=227290 RepID=UPI0008DC2755|nr:MULTISPECIES: 2'-deoxycytidine 5'-triphosphate deaminase [Rhizobium/Agrobacterium group]MCF1435468.1 2'-deoxycytidine 5'-triphosphate deaminase [Allorhizobium ampelinum]MCF1462111.1 2'-deoxycytidine 5'-triphosphate deaminase [Allorhizobium ampelinum]MCF1474445.1 2'-deoxycytidine 5'-triphosphate deaminase [Allorhizobium ampelinum]MCF1483390.1 2'-deoxycytidine 5'-triphosphate deaminase [Allorhizobium ampelinum]MUO88760.1 2'-deoxycytidine 5'-triphosphate deaminase [Agrobacterium vitis]
MTRNAGILADRAIGELFGSASLLSETMLDHDQIQPASLDLRLGSKALRVRASFMPGPNSTVADKLQRLTLHEIDLEHGAVLETGCVYIVPLMESLDLPADLSASTNPKSSTGRLDIFTRVMVDYAQEFDKIPAGYKGQLYLEISPRTFPIIVRRGSRLSQIRFRIGHALLSDSELLDLHKAETLVASETPNVSGGGIALSIDLKGTGPDGLVGYRGKHHTAVIDVDRKAAHDVLDFWEPLYSRGRDELILDPDEFYILVSREAVHVPPLYAAEMTPYDPLVGEFRVHYAGFFDPGFGHAGAGGTGSRAVLEVRSHEVPYILEHGQIIGRLVYEHMLEHPQGLYGTGLGSNYQAQGLKLSKHFRAA